MSRPFQPPSTTAEAVEQLRNLHNGLLRVGTLSQLPSGATSEMIVAKLNELLAALAQLVQAGNVRKR